MEENKEAVVEETTRASVKEEPKVDDTVEKIKVKKKPSMRKFSNSPDEMAKIDLSKPPTTQEDEQPTDTNEENVVQEKVVEEVTPEKTEEVKPETETEAPVIEDVTDEKIEEKTEELQEQVEEAIAEAEETGKPIPENIQKLMDFMEDTGGDYVKLNQDYSKLNDNDVLYEYYKQTKPHLTNEEINFLMEDSFSFEEEVDDERDIKRKKLALKEQVASARAHLDGQRSKYYEDIKAGSKLTQEQQKAIDFFNRYNKESETNQKIVKKNSDIFTKKTDQVFNDKFKGFEYNVGDKKYRFNIKDSNEVKQTQSDISNFTKKFLDKNHALKDAKGYHKSLFTAMNADAVASHFYEQGKADAIKDSIAKSKNVNMKPRQTHGEVEAGGIKVRVLGDNSSDFKFKIKNKTK
jgi:hypothetical protein